MDVTDTNILLIECRNHCTGRRLLVMSIQLVFPNPLLLALGPVSSLIFSFNLLTAVCKPEAKQEWEVLIRQGFQVGTKKEVDCDATEQWQPMRRARHDWQMSVCMKEGWVISASPYRCLPVGPQAGWKVMPQLNRTYSLDNQESCFQLAIFIATKKVHHLHSTLAHP